MSKIVDLLGAAAANPAPAEKPVAKAEGGAKKSFKPAPVEKAFVPTAVPTVKPCDKPMNMPAGCKPADMKSLKTI